MAWTDTSIPLLRVLINDIDAVLYSNDRLTDVLVSAAYMSVIEFDFDTIYTVNIGSGTVSPDPESDTDFVNLTCLKAAVLVYSGEMKTAANESIFIKDGTSTIDTKLRTRDAKTAYDEMFKIYGQAKQEFTLGNSLGVQAILGPYTSNYVSKGDNLR